MIDEAKFVRTPKRYYKNHVEENVTKTTHFKGTVAPDFWGIFWPAWI